MQIENETTFQNQNGGAQRDVYIMLQNIIIITIILVLFLIIYTNLHTQYNNNNWPGCPQFQQSKACASAELTPFIIAGFGNCSMSRRRKKGSKGGGNAAGGKNSMSSKLAAVRKNRKPPPFLSEFDRGVTKKMLRQMWEDEIIDDFDYEVNLKMLAESKKTPADMSDKELKEGLKKFKAWYPGQTREEMVYMLTYWRKRDTQLARLKEACQMGSYGAPEENIHKVRDEQFEKVTQFVRANYKNARACFINLVGFEKTWKNVPKVVLDNALVVVNSKREWVFFRKETTNKEHRKQKRYEGFDDEFRECPKTKEEQRQLYWFWDKPKFSSLSNF